MHVDGIKTQFYLRDLLALATIFDVCAYKYGICGYLPTRNKNEIFRKNDDVHCAEFITEHQPQCQTYIAMNSNQPNYFSQTILNAWLIFPHNKNNLIWRNGSAIAAVFFGANTQF